MRQHLHNLAYAVQQAMTIEERSLFLVKFARLYPRRGPHVVDVADCLIELGDPGESSFEAYVRDVLDLCRGEKISEPGLLGVAVRTCTVIYGHDGFLPADEVTWQQVQDLVQRTRRFISGARGT